MNNTQLFFLFLHHKIDSGEKQIDIATGIGVSSSYINKLYNTPPKRCSIEIQKKIANYFGMSYEEMIEESIFIQKDKNVSEREIINFKEKISKNPEDLIDHLSFVSSSLRENHEKSLKTEKRLENLFQVINNTGTAICIVNKNLCIEYQNTLHRKIFGDNTGNNYLESLERDKDYDQLISKLSDNERIKIRLLKDSNTYLLTIKAILHGNKIYKVVENVTDITEQIRDSVEASKRLELYDSVLSQIDEGVSLFDENRELVFSSNRWGLLDGIIHPGKKPTFEEVAFHLSKGISNWSQVQEFLEDTHFARKDGEIDIELLDGRSYKFQVRPVLKDGKYLGTLIINTPIKTGD